MQPNHSRIAIIGAGMVGSSIAYATMLKGLVAEIILIDVDSDRMQGEVKDLSHGVFGTDTGDIRAGDYSDCRNVDVLVITAGTRQQPGQTRLDLAGVNAGIIRDIAAKIGELDSHTKVLIVSNPVDILTNVAKQVFPLPEKQVFGTGTYLDTSRLRYLLSRRLSISTNNVHAYVLGEHGESQFVPWSVATAAGGRHLTDWLNENDMREIEEEVRHAAEDIISKKGSTYYGIATIVSEVLEAILHNKRKVVPVSTVPGPAYGITDVCMGVPAIIGANGIEDAWHLKMNDAENGRMHESAQKLREVLGSISQ